MVVGSVIGRRTFVKIWLDTFCVVGKGMMGGHTSLLSVSTFRSR